MPSPDILLAAVRRSRARTRISTRAVSRQLVQAGTSPDDLTTREIDVLRRLALGRSNKEIAASLAIGEETVKTHVGRGLAKLQVDNRAQASCRRSAAAWSRLRSCSSPPRDTAAWRPSNGPPDSQTS